MIRKLSLLTENVFDVLVIGGGIYGAALAWEAAHRGLSVALVEKSDFTSATSANSMKIIHGGFRYLQNLDFRRMRQSIVERRTLLNNAPHLVHPLPVIVPTYGHGFTGREAMSAAVRLYDLISIDRNMQVQPQKYIPPGKQLSKDECLGILPGLEARDLTGGVIFYDSQVYNSERLVLAYLQSAFQAGADLANYCEAVGLILEKGKVIGVDVQDRLTGDKFQIRTKIVLNACGPWIYTLLEQFDIQLRRPISRFTKAFNLITRQILKDIAVGIPGVNGTKNLNGTKPKSRPFLFIAPWRDYSIIGTGYKIFQENPDGMNLDEEEIQEFIGQFNQACPSANIQREEVFHIHLGLSPIIGMDQRSGSMELSRRYRIMDHRKEGIQGLMSVEGVKYTTARQVAEDVINKVYDLWGYLSSPSRSCDIPLFGGDIPDIEEFLQSETNERLVGLPKEQVCSLIYNYGSRYRDMLKEDKDEISLMRNGHEGRSILRAQVLYSIRHEMAVKLGDVIFRRTELGTAGRPSEGLLSYCAGIMGDELSWSENRVREEIDEVRGIYTYSNP
jgi:glycerol-3-phosphate dehydrogenase